MVLLPKNPCFITLFHYKPSINGGAPIYGNLHIWPYNNNWRDKELEAMPLASLGLLVSVTCRLVIRLGDHKSSWPTKQVPSVSTTTHDIPSVFMRKPHPNCPSFQIIQRLCPPILGVFIIPISCPFRLISIASTADGYSRHPLAAGLSHSTRKFLHLCCWRSHISVGFFHTMVLRCCCKLYEHISYTHVLYLYGHDTGYCTVYIYMYFFIHASYIIYSMLPVVVVGVSYLCPSLPGKVRSPSWLDPICLGRGETTNLHIYYLHLHRSIFVYITIHICLSLNILAKVYIIIHIYIYLAWSCIYIYARPILPFMDHPWGSGQRERPWRSLFLGR
jgi:hypothetical protein